MKRSDITTEQVVRACFMFHERISNEAPWKILMKKTGAPEKVVYAAMQRDEDRGYIESGVSTRTAWPTAKGMLLLIDREVMRDICKAFDNYMKI
jgi:hypothetical protein